MLTEARGDTELVIWDSGEFGHSSVSFKNSARLLFIHCLIPLGSTIKAFIDAELRRATTIFGEKAGSGMRFACKARPLLVAFVLHFPATRCERAAIRNCQWRRDFALELDPLFL